MCVCVCVCVCTHFIKCLFICLFLVVLVFVAVLRLSLVSASRGCSLAAGHRLLTAVVSLVAEHGLYGTRASVVMAHEL